jgi:hypothetical protein
VKAVKAIVNSTRSSQEPAVAPKQWVQKVASWTTQPKNAAAATAGVCAAVIAAQLDADAAQQAFKVGLASRVKSAQYEIQRTQSFIRIRWTRCCHTKLLGVSWKHFPTWVRRIDWLRR